MDYRNFTLRNLKLLGLSDFDLREINLRELINNNAGVVTVLAVLLLMLILAMVLWAGRGPVRPTLSTYYYDLNTQTIFADRVGLATPYEGESGTFAYVDGVFGAVVEASVFTCGDPEQIHSGMTRDEIEAAGGFIAYLKRLTPTALAVREKMDAGQELTPEEYDAMYYDGELFAGPDGDKWFRHDTASAMELLDGPYRRCDDQTSAVACTP